MQMPPSRHTTLVQYWSGWYDIEITIFQPCMPAVIAVCTYNIQKEIKRVKITSTTQAICMQHRTLVLVQRKHIILFETITFESNNASVIKPHWNRGWRDTMPD